MSSMSKLPGAVSIDYNCQQLFNVFENQQTMEVIRRAVRENTLPQELEFFKGLLGSWDVGSDIIFRGDPGYLERESLAADGTASACR